MDKREEIGRLLGEVARVLGRIGMGCEGTGPEGRSESLPLQSHQNQTRLLIGEHQPIHPQSLPRQHPQVLPQVLPCPWVG